MHTYIYIYILSIYLSIFLSTNLLYLSSRSITEADGVVLLTKTKCVIFAINTRSKTIRCSCLINF